MTRLIREIYIDAPKEKVWQVLADFGGVYIYNPTVPKSYSTSKANGGVGATRHCDLTTKGASIEERILEWSEGEGYTLEIYDGQKAPPFKMAIASLTVREEGDGAIVTGTLEYMLKFGLVGTVMDNLIVKAQFHKAWARLFAGLKHYCETGEPVDAATSLNLNAVAIPA